MCRCKCWHFKFINIHHTSIYLQINVRTYQCMQVTKPFVDRPHVILRVSSQVWQFNLPLFGAVARTLRDFTFFKAIFISLKRKDARNICLPARLNFHRKDLLLFRPAFGLRTQRRCQICSSSGRHDVARPTDRQCPRIMGDSD